ncbi:MAG TPA: hypothetical protein VK843_15630 [Planctomycetota bacterium]|nr:hypothetical protein [Planctomycetota bacterium]
MNHDLEDLVWNRAAMESGGDTPGPGDRALTALLRLHGLVMNGGVHHAMEVLNPAELCAASDGFSYFGFESVGSFFRSASPMLAECTDETEVAADRRYSELVPDDEHLFRRFQNVFRERADQFAPIDPGL